MWKVISKYKNIEPYSSDKVDIETCLDSQKLLTFNKKKIAHLGSMATYQDFIIGILYLPLLGINARVPLFIELI